MKKINWNNVEEATEQKRIGPGGYVCEIVSVEDHPDDEYLQIDFDVAEGPFRNYFTEQYKQWGNWPWQASFRRYYTEKSQPFFKGFLTCIHKSNPGYTFNNDDATLKGKSIGLILGEEEYWSNYHNDIRSKLAVTRIVSADTIKKGAFKVPAKKLLSDEERARHLGFQEIDDANFVTADDPF